MILWTVTANMLMKELHWDEVCDLIANVLYIASQFCELKRATVVLWIFRYVHGERKCSKNYYKIL